MRSLSKKCTIHPFDVCNIMARYAALDAAVTFALWQHCKAEIDAALKGA
jgi:hypothetical protein